MEITRGQAMRAVEALGLDPNTTGSVTLTPSVAEWCELTTEGHFEPRACAIVKGG